MGRHRLVEPQGRVPLFHVLQNSEITYRPHRSFQGRLDFSICQTFKNSKDYGEPDITYQLAGCGETPNGVPWWYGEGGYIPKIV